ncbi:MAG: NAD(+) synthase [Bacteroidales bacterium]|nr:NAD(+) synthase [Clostridium sp.]MCM1204638.1 NAD(+) synthase [Bacteroidales bacterium]
MRDGFIKAAAAAPELRVADCGYNGKQIFNTIREAEEKGVKILVFPELCISGYTCGDLFLQDALLKGCEDALEALLKKTADLDILYVVGMPVVYFDKLYNAAVFCQAGKILMVVPKTNIPNYQEFYEMRHFAQGFRGVVSMEKLAGCRDVAFGTDNLLICDTVPGLVIAGEVCEDLWVPDSPSIRHALAGATLICNVSASDEIATKPEYRRKLAAMQSAKLMAAYIYADAGNDESTQDVVYSGHHILAENGSVLAEGKGYGHGLAIAEFDIGRLSAERRKTNTFKYENDGYGKQHITFRQETTALTRGFSRTPFVPSEETKKKQRCEEILTLQAMGLRKRLAHTGCRSAVIGLSGGLDSTLALLVTVKAYDLLGLEHRDIIAVTMPGFGTTDRTYQNALKLAGSLGATLKEISIVDAVRQHFKDIGQDEQTHDVTYENGQARERTQILMDIANQCNGLVIGTGDMSEMALGWATYNGDHMSMYAVNVSIPKTLVRYLVAWYAEETDEQTAAVLKDILATPVSPELLPPENGEIAQKTEDIVGPYELHDFVLYYLLRFGYTPSKIYRLAKLAFSGVYEDEVILKWMKTFYRRFFAQQFKRSCVPDGPKVGTVSLSPRGDLRMPSDACADLWLKELDGLD